MLQVNSTLQELNLGGNPSCQIMRECQNTVFGYMTTDNKIGPEGAKALSDMLHTTFWFLHLQFRYLIIHS